MGQKNEQNKIECILNEMYLIIETKPYKKNQLVKFKGLIKRVHSIHNKNLLYATYVNRDIDLISSICKHNKKNLLRYILHESNILHYFTCENKDKERQYREDAFYYAICFNQFEMIEMLYDHWTGDLHWVGHKTEYNEFDVENLKQINEALKTALQRYENWMLSKVTKKFDQTTMFNIEGLVAFSEFQIDLYTQLNKVKENLIESKNEPEDTLRIKETYAIRSIILDMFDCYEEHTSKLGSIIQNSVLDIPSKYSEPSEFSDIIEIPKDNSELLRKTYLYVFHDVYFRKLDYNVCLLILDNLHSLKLRLIMPENAYQVLENKLYHFIYHLSSNWNLYIPKRANMKTKTYTGKYNDISCIFLLKYNADMFEKGINIVYLEKRDFENTLRDFKDKLKQCNIEENIRQDNIEFPSEEINALKLLPELRDIYALKKISQQIAQLYSVDVSFTGEYRCLLVERSLQILGEFLKSTKDSLHLQPTTESLVDAEISVEVVNDLKIIRDFLSHAKKCKLLKRIEMEKNNSVIFDKIFVELKLFKKKIDEVIQICKPLVERALILTGLSLIEKRRNEMSDVIGKDLFDAIKRVRLVPSVELFWAPKGCADEYATELITLVEHSLQLDTKLLLVTENIRKNLAQKFPIYKEAINTSLQKIIEVKEIWQQIVTRIRAEEPTITLSNYPNEDDSNRIKTYSKKIDLGDNLNNFVEDNKLFAYIEIHWKFIRNLIEFIIFKTDTTLWIPTELDKITQEIKNLSYNDNNIGNLVGKYLIMVEKKNPAAPGMQYLNQYSEFNGVKELRRKLTKVNFLIQEERDYLNDTLKSLRDKVNIKQQNKITEILVTINNDKEMPQKKYANFVNVINLDQKAQKYLMNLVMGYERDPLHPWCLSKRITLLREITKEQTINLLVTRYKLDKTFRALLEVLVFDIFAILACTKNKNIVLKSSKLLTEINLRNFLIHGSPLLEIVGSVLDSNDLPTELITKALELVREESSINALCALKDLDFDFTQIHTELACSEHLSLVTEFKRSPLWKDYLMFIPKINTARRNIAREVDMNLLEAVKQKNVIKVQEIINAGGNVNFIDDGKRALIHHAAIKRDIDVIKVLINNNINVNIPSKHNVTALHFAAMNGFTDIVELLLKNGADYLAVNDKGQTPYDVADQRNHTDICQMLAQVMKK